MKSRLALVDCNNFFCSCERVFAPDLHGKPVVVLSNNDGCIISRSEEAKAVGIPMGAPRHEQEGVIRKHGVKVLSSNYTLYGDMSARVMTILRDAALEMEVYSIDEAFLKLPEEFGEKEARALRAKVLRWTGIPVCIGIGTTKMLAKVANREAKKRREQTGGVLDLDGGVDVEELLDRVPCDGLWGVGKRLAQRLAGLGIHTAREFRQADPRQVRQSLGVVGERMWWEMNGVSCLPWEETPPDRKGVVASRSFGATVETLEELEVALAHHVARASEKIRRMGLKASRIEVFLQTNRFRVGEAQYCPVAGLNLDEPSASTSELLGRARELLKEIYRSGFRYQKTGVSLGRLVREEGIQECLPFVGSRKASLVVDAIVDRINQRLGDRKNPVITRGAMGTKLSPQRWRMKSGLRSPAYTTSWADLPIAVLGEMKRKRN